MTDDIEAAVEVHQRELIESAATLYAVQKIYGDKVREQSKTAYRRLVDAHLLPTLFQKQTQVVWSFIGLLEAWVVLYFE